MPNNMQIESNNLKVLEDQLNHEALMNKKFHEVAGVCQDSNLKNLCNQAANVHKQNFTSLKSYLDSHQ